MSRRTLNVALIGHRFMGKAHSQAWLNAGRYFDLDADIALKVVCGRDSESLGAFAGKWGWAEISTDWKEAVEREDVDIVDIATPTALHHDIAVAAAGAGKHIFCEKPFALGVGQAQSMLHAVEKAGVTHYLNHNYRRCPAVMLASQLIDEGRIGRIFHWRGAYLQSWLVDPNVSLTWQLRADQAGAGPHYDLLSHSVDLARFLVGEVKSVTATLAHFVSERPIASPGAASRSTSDPAAPRGKVTVDDASLMTVEFENGAIGSFEASRFALGRKNSNTFEIYGSNGAVAFDLERMNELQYFDGRDPQHAHGFRTILATDRSHPYMKHWWPPGHIIGYEHAFTHAVADFIGAVMRREPIRPNFEDGLKCMQILDAGLQSAKAGVRMQLRG